MNDLFEHGTDPLEVQREHWDLTGLVPVPRFNVSCPCCGASRSSRAIQARTWQFHEAPSLESAYRHRCAISFKCRHCSHVFHFGVVVPDAMAKAAEHHDRKYLTWRQAAQLLRTGEVT